MHKGANPALAVPLNEAPFSQAEVFCLRIYITKHTGLLTFLPPLSIIIWHSDKKHGDSMVILIPHHFSMLQKLQEGSAHSPARMHMPNQEPMHSSRGVYAMHQNPQKHFWNTTVLMLVEPSLLLRSVVIILLITSTHSFSALLCPPCDQVVWPLVDGITQAPCQGEAWQRRSSVGREGGQGSPSFTPQLWCLASWVAVFLQN